LDGADHWRWAAGISFLLGSAFFAATDAALGALGEVRARQLLEGGGAKARLLSAWVKHPERVNAVLTVGATLVSAGMGALLALGARARTLGALASAALVAGGLLLVVGQLIPRVVGKRFPARTAIAAMPVVHLLYWTLWPLVTGLERGSRWIARRVGEDAGAKAVTTEELEYLIEVGTREGAFDEVREELLNSVLEFADRVVREIMVPRTRMVALDRNAPPEEIARLATENPYSRMPVYEGSADNVVGVLLLRDLIPELARGGRAVRLDKYLKAPYFVPEQMKISRLLKEMQRRKLHLAIVVDEFGGTSGIVTLEDVIEEIVGEIQDEADAEAAPVRAVGQGVFLADASVPLHQLEEFLNVEAGDAPEREVRFPDDGDYETLAGFVSTTAGRVPPVGAQVDWDGLRFTVRAADERRVLKVEIARREHSEPGPAARAVEQGS
jgi:CBS domain containing-hemolysin-like protein